MSDHDQGSSEECEYDERRRKLAHDIQHCLHVVLIGLDLLRDVRENDERFAEVCQTIAKERKQATELVSQLSELARARRD